jgi:hypothetical protein
VIGATKEVLNERLKTLLGSPAERRVALFKNSPTGKRYGKPVGQIKSADDVAIRPYGFRSFDVQWLIADARFLDRAGPPLWGAHSDKQVYLTSLFNHPLGAGPALTASAFIPDLHHFRGSYGAKEVMPLFRDAKGTLSNVSAPALDALGLHFGQLVTAQDVFGYVYGVLAQPRYTELFSGQLSTREVRVPVTKEWDLFVAARDIGKRLLWLHTFGERFFDGTLKKGKIPHGQALCLKGVGVSAGTYPQAFSYNESTKTLHLGDGEFGPVSEQVWNFEVSGMKIVQSWLAYRVGGGSGKKSSELDEIRPVSWTHAMTRELLEILWVLEATLAGYAAQGKVLDSIIAGDLFKHDEIPAPPPSAREAPKATTATLNQIALDLGPQ